MWEVSGTDEFAAWYGSLDVKDQSKVVERVELLAQSARHSPSWTFRQARLREKYFICCMRSKEHVGAFAIPRHDSIVLTPWTDDLMTGCAHNVVHPMGRWRWPARHTRIGPRCAARP